MTLMSGIDIAILASSMLATILLTRFNGTRAWWQSLSCYRPLAVLVIITVISTYIGGMRTEGSSQLLDPIRMVRMGFVSVICIWSLLTIARQPVSWRLAGTGAKAMMIYAFIAIVSATYSVNALLTLWKGFEVLTLVLVGIAVAGKLKNSGDVRWALDLLSLILLFLAITVLAGFIITPEEAFRELNIIEQATSAAEKENLRQYAFIVRGVMPQMHPTAVGGIGALLLVLTLTQALNKQLKVSKTGLWIVIGIALSIIILAHARTAIFSVSMVVVIILIYNNYLKQAIIVGIFGLLILLVTASFDFILGYIYRGQSHEQFLELSGRTNFWPFVFEKVLDAPLLGYGFYASHRVLFGTSGVDNTYLDILLGNGLLGIIVFLIPLLYAGITLLRTRPKNRVLEYIDIMWLQLLSAMTILFIRSLTGTSYQVFYHLLVFYMLILVSIAALARIRREQRENIGIGSNHAIESHATASEKNTTHFPRKQKKLLTTRSENRKPL